MSHGGVKHSEHEIMPPYGVRGPEWVKVLANEVYDAHTAIDDLAALAKLLRIMKTSAQYTNDCFCFLSHSVSFDSACAKLDHQISTNQNLETMQALIEGQKSYR